MSAKHVVKFTPAMWHKWREARALEDARTQELKEGIALMRQFLAARDLPFEAEWKTQR